MDQGQPPAQLKKLSRKFLIVWVIVLLGAIVGSTVALFLDQQAKEKNDTNNSVTLTVFTCFGLMGGCAVVYAVHTEWKKNPAKGGLRLVMEYSAVGAVLGMHISLVELVTKNSIRANIAFDCAIAATMIAAKLGNPEKPHFLFKATVLQFLGITVACFWNHDNDIPNHLVKGSLLLAVTCMGIFLMFCHKLDLENAQEVAAEAAIEIVPDEPDQCPCW